MMSQSIIEEIESLTHDRLRFYEFHLKIDPRTTIKQPLTVERSLSIREKRILNLLRYNIFRKWRFCGEAFLLNNTCTKCGRKLYVALQTTPAYTWKRKYGRKGFLVYCPHCHKDIDFFLTVLN